ncbi:TRAP transporter small permease [Zhengella sp. ZM62]|uniref:TRAP transporter small permease n=1 Tax=Zhengella sedimenti TaxID=3390035 RepID=UPI00397517A8
MTGPDENMGQDGGGTDMLMRIADMASWVLMTIGGLAIIVLMLHITADVAGKYFFNQPIIGTLEIVSRYYMVACVFLPLAFVQIRRQHLTVEMFTMGLSKRRLAGLDGVVSIAGLAYVGLLTWLVLDQAAAATRDREILSLSFFDLPAWPSRWILPLSFGLFAFVLAIQAWIDLRYALTGRGHPTIERKTAAGGIE